MTSVPMIRKVEMANWKITRIFLKLTGVRALTFIPFKIFVGLNLDKTMAGYVPAKSVQIITNNRRTNRFMGS